ncbi:MAG: formate dehydrogenase accessory sulfurtransferase FdhD [Anaerolineae bacterium]
MTQLEERIAISTYSVHRVTSQGRQDVQAEVILEEPLAIEVNGREIAVLMRLPGQEKELAVGFLLSEGIISDFRAVQMVHHCGQGLPSPDDDFSRNRVQIRVDPAGLRSDRHWEKARLIRSGCGAVDLAIQDIELPPVESDLTVKMEVLFGLNSTLRQHQRAYKLAGGVHAAALFLADGHLLTLQEDIGRHNAVDKVLGYCILRGIPLEDKLLLSTGRASYEMVAKAARLGVPLLASTSSPTSLAVDLARQVRCTLVGYLRSKSMNIYTHSWRILE